MQGIDIYQILWFFMIYAFLGWCMEVVYAALVLGQFVNRGFLNGPVCPIYGFGVIGVIFALRPVSDNLPLLFLGSVLLTSVLEWLTGFVLEKMFSNKWWDYSDKPFNLNGYICLAFSVLWGLACVFVIKLMHPTVMAFVDFMPIIVGWTILGVGVIVFISDIALTVFAVIGLNKRLEQLDLIASRLKFISDELGENISEYTLSMMEKNEQLREILEVRLGGYKEGVGARVEGYKQEAEAKLESYRLEAESLLNSQKELIAKSKVVQKRLVRAFPKLSSKRFELGLSRFKEEVNKFRKIG